MVVKVSRRLSVLLFVTVCIFVFMMYLFISFHQETIAKLPLSNRVVVLDAGHGGMDGGAESESGIKEKEINLKIAEFLKCYLEQGGAKVIMTRKEDVSLHDDDNASIKNRKRQDLLNRKKIANDSGADILVSIHLNQFEQSKYKGAQVFYEKNFPKSHTLATAIQNALRDNVDKTNNRVEMQIADNKLQFQNLNLPAVIVECGFLSNPEEALMLNTEEYQKKIALAVYVGILSYYNQ